jgi:hypothetical protein
MIGKLSLLLDGRKPSTECRTYRQIAQIIRPKMAFQEVGGSSLPPSKHGSRSESQAHCQMTRRQRHYSLSGWDFHDKDCRRPSSTIPFEMLETSA